MRRPGWWKLWILAPILLVILAIIPWLVPWPSQDPPERDTAEPAGVPASAPATTSKPPPEPEPATTNSSAGTPGGSTDGTVDRTDQKGADEEAYDLPVDRAEVKGASTEPGPYVPLGRIAIDKLGLDVTFGEGVLAETLDRGPGHWPGTPMPGRSGNSVLAGHRTTNTQPFLRIDGLDRGDEIVVKLKGKKPVTYLVESTTVVPEPEYRQFVLRQPKNDDTRQLTLFACHPEGDPVNRIVVRAKAQPA